MPLTNYTNLDFAQVKQSLQDYLQSNSNFTDYDFEGSNLSTILDVLAYNTYITSYNANMVANEVFLDSATLRENVVSIARTIGYLPRSRKAARATISFYVDVSNVTPAPTSLTLRKGPVATSNGSFNSGSYIFSILDDITVPVQQGLATFQNIPIYEGVLVSQNFTYNSRTPYQRFILPNTGIDTELMSVFVKQNEDTNITTRYTLQNNLFQVDSISNIYYMQEIEDERYEIFFGDGIFGRKLEDGNYITANYIVSNGDAGNGVSGFSFAGRLTYVRNSKEYSINAGISLLTTGVTSSGGDSIESVESVKKFAPTVYATQNRAVTSSDYEALIPSRIYPEAESISVFGGEELVPPQYGKVFISIKPRFGDFIPNLIKENIKTRLKKYSVAGIVTEILDLKYLFIEIDSKVYYNSNYTSSAQALGGKIQANAEKYANSTELNKYGARFKYSKFLKILDETDQAITSNITTVSMRRDLRVVKNAFAEYSIGFGNRFHIKNLIGFNIKSSAFRISGVESDLYMSDLPNADRVQGSLFFFTVPSVNSQTPQIIRRNVGTVDYINGIITINPVNIISGKDVDGQTIIEISVNPFSNDVVGLQDLYLQLDIGSSTFDMIVDDISSGVDSSASTFITSSSYPNGSLVRAGGSTQTTNVQQAVLRNAVNTTLSPTYNTGGARSNATEGSVVTSTQSVGGTQTGGSSGGYTSGGSSSSSGGGSSSSGGGSSSSGGGGGYSSGY